MSNFKCLEKYFLESIAIKTSLLKDPSIKDSIIDLSNIALKTVKSGGKIILAGNGGSFADAQHITAGYK